MKTLRTLTLLLYLCPPLPAQPVINWQKAVGGTDFEVPASIHARPDGGFIIAATTYSNDMDAVGNHGLDDMLLVKLRADRSIEWRKLFGGSNEDGVHDLQPTSDGGFILAGFTKSNDGHVTGFKGQTDYWLVKTDSQGNLLWQQTYGGSKMEVASAVRQTPDGGYIVAGYTTSNDGQVTNNHKEGVQDAWIVKLDAAGNIQWQRCYGGSDAEFAYTIEPVNGGYIFGGYARSADGDLTANKGRQDAWIVRLDLAGNIVWQQAVGGSGNEAVETIIPAAGGGYLAAGNTSSADGDIHGQHGATDGLLIKLAADGSLQWTRCYGGSSLDGIRCLVPAAGSNFYAIGSAESDDGDIGGNYGKSDYLVMFLDAGGNLGWQKNLGGSNIDDGFAACLSGPGELVIAGTSFSQDADVTEWKAAGDIWVVALKPHQPVPVITQSPSDTAACAASDVSFTVAALHGDHYQWQVLTANGWSDLANSNTYRGVTTPVLTAMQISPALHLLQYRCRVSNAAGSVLSGTATLSIIEPPKILANPVSPTACVASRIQLQISATGATGFQWQQSETGAAWQDIPGADSATTSILVNGKKMYRCVVRNGCGVVPSAIATVEPRNCSIPNAFSPNGDGLNDYWNLPLLRSHPNGTVIVFSRYGNKIFESKGYPRPWDGNSNGKPLPVGVYYYLVDLKDGSSVLSGSITLLR